MVPKPALTALRVDGTHLSPQDWRRMVLRASPVGWRRIGVY